MSEARDAMTAAEVRSVITGMLGGWGAGGSQLKPRRKQGELARRLAVFALAAHAHQMALAALTLIDRGMIVESSPSVRLVWESAITAHWIAQVDDASLRHNQEGWHKLRQVQRRVNETGWPNITADTSEADESIQFYDDLVGRQRLDFRKLCHDLRGGAALYAYLAMWSSECHAGPAIVDRYVTAPDDPAALRLSLEPEQPDHRGSLWLMAVALVYAGRSVDFTDPTHRRRNELRRIARRLEIPEVLAAVA